jgi:hypothetical protein
MTSMPTLGILGSPFTLIFGPVFTYTGLTAFAFFSSAASMMFVCRRWVQWLPAAFLAGLLYGFSPDMISQGWGHVFLFSTALFPLMLLMLDEIIIRQTRSPGWLGVLLGILFALQLGISPELLVDAILLAVIGILAIALRFRSQIVERSRYVGHSLLGFAVITIPVSAIYVRSFMEGSGGGLGQYHTTSTVAGLSADVANLVSPSTLFRFNFGLGHWTNSLVGFESNGFHPDPYENGAYIGLALLLFIVGAVIIMRKIMTVQIFSFLAIASLLLSLGSTLSIFGVNTGIPLPFKLLTDLPIFNNSIAIRWSGFMWLFVSLLVALAVEELHIRTRLLRMGEGSRGFIISAWILLGIGLVALVPLWPYPTSRANVPAWFASGTKRNLSPAEVLFVFPTVFAPGDSALPMMWQAVDAFTYRIVGGKFGPQSSSYGALESGSELCGLSPTLSEPPSTIELEARQEMRSVGIGAVVMPPIRSVNRSCAIKFMNSVTSLTPRLEDGALVWRLR